MKKLLVIVAFLVVGYKVLTVYQAAGAKLDPQYPEPYIVIYGRKTSGDTVHLQSALYAGSYRYHFVDMDAPGASDGLHARMRQAGLDIKGYSLPVVEVNARMQANPKPEWVIETYRVDRPVKKP
jgi:hypothetical protein